MKKLYTSLLLSLVGGTTSLMAQNSFPTLDLDIYNETTMPVDPATVILAPSPLKYDVMFTGGVDMVYDAKNDAEAVAKEWHDFTGYVAIDNRSDSGYVIVNHERIQKDDVLGDGGGMTVFTVWKNPALDRWQVVEDNDGNKFRNVDFSSVGNTLANCGGIQTSWGRVFTAEEWTQSSNKGIFNNGAGITDTSDWNVTSFNGSTIDEDIEKYLNYNWMVEVDVENAVAVRKNYNMGRFAHEGGWIASDDKTVYLSDDASSGSVLFKFVAETAQDFSEGQLYFYKQSEDANTGSWEALTMDLTTMINVRDSALSHGATIFMRLEWVEGNDNFVYITETGRGKVFDVSGAIAKGGVLANHLQVMDAADGTEDGQAEDLFGRVLRLNPTTGKVSVLIEGGGALDSDNTPVNNHLSSPDGLCLTTIFDKTILAINEDMNPSGLPANPTHFNASKTNEIYFLDITDDSESTTFTETDLVRIAVGPQSCETTGGRFTPDGSTYFVNIQHPSSSNVTPFNHSVTIAITGFDEKVTGLFDAVETSDVKISPNPVSRELNIHEVADVRIFSIGTGKIVKVSRQSSKIDVSNLSKGSYILQFVDGRTVPFIVQ